MFDGHLAQGIGFGFAQTKATLTYPFLIESETEITANHFPVYYAPEYTFLEPGFFNVFVKGAFGMHFSSYNRAGELGDDLKHGDFGFYGGFGAGTQLSFSEYVFLILEYEWAYLSNSIYRDGFLNSLLLSVGYNFQLKQPVNNVGNIIGMTLKLDRKKTDHFIHPLPIILAF